VLGLHPTLTPPRLYPAPFSFPLAAKAPSPSPSPSPNLSELTARNGGAESCSIFENGDHGVLVMQEGASIHMTKSMVSYNQGAALAIDQGATAKVCVWVWVWLGGWE
jgi:hypothetical protein